MMSLVAQYSDSSDEGSDQEDTETTPVPSSITKPIATNSKGLNLPAPKVEHSTEVTPSVDRSMFMSLPAPKSEEIIEEDISDIPTVKVAPPSKQKIKITIPSLSDFKDDEDSAPRIKKIKPTPKGSGLLSLLPEPKNTKPSGAMLPYSLTRKPVPKKPPPPKKKPITKPTTSIVSDYPDSDESGDETEQTSVPSSGIDFFSLTCQSAPEPADINLEDLLPPVSGPKSRPPTKHVVEVQEQVQEWSQETVVQEQQEQDVQLNDEALRQLCGRRVQRGAEEVNIIELHGDNMMPDPKEWMLKHLTEEQDAHTQHRSSQPNTSHKRKHQITYLAYQAKEREIELKNQWSQNRMTKKQTQAKYGF